MNGSIGKTEVHYQRVNVEDVKRLLSVPRTDIPVYESKVKWPAFLLRTTQLVPEICRHLVNAEVKRLQERQSSSN